MTYCHHPRWLLVLAATAAPFLLVATPASAQQQDGQLWLQVNTSVPLNEDLRATFEQIARFGDRTGGLYQTEIGALLGLHVARNVELGVGYRRVGFYNDSEAPGEHRLRQQVVTTLGRLVTRLRLDERFRDGGGEVGFRLRPLVRYNHPLREDGKVALFLSHESFILPNSTDWGQRRGYERMRNILGISFPLARRVSVDAGYLNQYRPSRDGARAQMDHALTMQFSIDLKPTRGARADD